MSLKTSFYILTEYHSSSRNWQAYFEFLYERSMVQPLLFGGFPL